MSKEKGSGPKILLIFSRVTDDVKTVAPDETQQKMFIAQ